MSGLISLKRRKMRPLKAEIETEYVILNPDCEKSRILKSDLLSQVADSQVATQILSLAVTFSSYNPLPTQCSAKRNTLQWTSLLHQITQYQLPFLSSNLIINGAAPNLQTNSAPFTAFFFSSKKKNSGLESPEVKEPVLFDLFRSYGFTDTQIKRITHKTLRVHSTEIIKPKLEHLLAFGFSPAEPTALFCYDRYVLLTSLKNPMVPNLRLLEETLGSKAYVIKAINDIHGSALLRYNLETTVMPNVKLLREHGITTDKIAALFMKFPLVLFKHPDIITETMAKLKVLGMCPSKLSFIKGMHIMLTYKKETLERKMELFRSFGWSENDTLSVLSRQPNCFGIGDDNIKKKMHFFMKKLHWDSAMPLRLPVILLLSLEGRVIPRCAVMNVLAKRKLWKGKPNLYSVFVAMSPKDFKEGFVDKYEKDVPEVVDAYQGKIEFVGFDRKY